MVGADVVLGERLFVVRGLAPHVDDAANAGAGEGPDLTFLESRPPGQLRCNPGDLQGWAQEPPKPSQHETPHARLSPPLPRPPVRASRRPLLSRGRGTR